MELLRAGIESEKAIDAMERNKRRKGINQEEESSKKIGEKERRKV